MPKTMEADEKGCPLCARIIKVTDVTCKHCGHDLSVAPRQNRNPSVPHRPKNSPTEYKKLVLFTGFKKGEKARLKRAAEAIGLRPVTGRTVPRDLGYLVTGDKDAPAKSDAAKKYGAEVITREKFLTILKAAGMDAESFAEDAQ